MKKFFVLFYLFTLLACSSSQQRGPSASTDDIPQVSCGFLQANETSRTAYDLDEEQVYTLHLDCDNSKTRNRPDGHAMIGFFVSSLSAQQKVWLKRKQVQAIKSTHRSSELPYVCARYRASTNPCTNFKNGYGYEAQFYTPNSTVLMK